MFRRSSWKNSWTPSLQLHKLDAQGSTWDVEIHVLTNPRACTDRKLEALEATHKAGALKEKGWNSLKKGSRVVQNSDSQWIQCVGVSVLNAGGCPIISSARYQLHRSCGVRKPTCVINLMVYDVYGFYVYNIYVYKEHDMDWSCTIIISHHIISYHTISYDIISYYIFRILYDMIGYYIILYQIMCSMPCRILHIVSDYIILQCNSLYVPVIL